MDLTGLISFSVILQFFVLLNPLSSFPLLMVAYKKKLDVKTIAYKSVITAFVIALSIVFVGPVLFNLFGITLDSFRVAGGVVLLLLGLDTVRSKKKYEDSDGSIDSLTSIIATPLLTGPAVISFITIQAYEIGQVATIANLFLAFILVAISFILFAFFIPNINEKIISILAKVLGLFLTAVAIQMIAKGLMGLFGAG